MARIKSELVLADLVLLRVIAQHPCVPKRALWGPHHAGLWNKALKPLVEMGRCGWVASDYRFNDTIATLRHCHLITNDPPYEVTREAERLLFVLPKSVKRWPVILPLCPNGERDWDAAEYDHEPISGKE